MRRPRGNCLLSLGVLGCLLAATGCASDGGVRERRQQQSELSADLNAADDDINALLASPEVAGDDAPEMPAKADLAAGDDLFGEPAPASFEEAPAPARSRGDVRGSSVTDAMNDAREELSLRKQEARYYARQGDRHFDQNRFAEAEAAYRAALDLDYSLEDARRRYHQAQVSQGKRQGESLGVLQSLSNHQRVMAEQRRLEIRRNLTAVDEALAAGDIDRATDFADRASAAALRDAELDEELAAAVRVALDKVRQEKAKLDRENQDRVIAEVDERVRIENERQNERIQNQAQNLLRKTADFMRVGEYDRAVEACERILQLDPDNRIAKFWLADATEQQVNRRRLKLIDDRIDNERLLDEGYLAAAIPYDEFFVFPDDEYWQRVQQRTGDITLSTVDEPEPVRRMKELLRTQRIGLLLKDDDLAVAVEQLRHILGINIVIDPAVDPESITMDMSVQNLPAINVLNLLLERAGLSYTYRSNVLYITDAEGARGDVKFVIYSVADILNRIRDFQGPELILRGPNDAGAGESPVGFTEEISEEASEVTSEELEELIQASTGIDLWGDTNTMEYHNGQLLVNATPELHEEIERVFENLRQDADLFVVIEARFLDITDDFLEDVGVDSRALGLVNNWGTPFGNQINDDSTGGQDLGFVKQGSPVRDVTLVMGQDRWAGRIQHIVDGFTGTVRGDRLRAGSGASGLTMQSTWLEPFQINTILRAVQEKSDVRQLTAPVITAHNGQRVYVSVITQRAYIADYELVSGGTGFSIVEVADPVVQTFQEGVILDVDPVVHHDKKYITLDVRPTLATLTGGVISTIQISLGSFQNVAFQVPIGVPEISLQQSFTTVTVPNGGTVLLGGFKSMTDSKFEVYLPILGRIPLIKNLFRRKAKILEKRSLVILLTARIVDLRGEEARKFNSF